ncbi:hypothetical protein AC1031_013522 [Aphanomyces cochlioides]|nr:hypothetical protein AC1031_013522 [Aphanomyces cochlioides]
MRYFDEYARVVASGIPAADQVKPGGFTMCLDLTRRSVEQKEQKILGYLQPPQCAFDHEDYHCFWIACYVRPIYRLPTIVYVPTVIERPIFRPVGGVVVVDRRRFWEDSNTEADEEAK